MSQNISMCRYSYSLSHEKSEKMFWIVTWRISHRFRDKRRFPSKIANFSHPRVYIAPAGIGYRPRASQSFNAALQRQVKSFVRSLYTCMLIAVYSTVEGLAGQVVHRDQLICQPCTPLKTLYLPMHICIKLNNKFN